MDSNSIFLTVEDAIDAMTIDFRQYRPQILLFCSINHLISGNEIRFQRETGNDGVCTIHEAKPQICRSYPVSRKHAVMTGCRGFETRNEVNQYI